MDGDAVCPRGTLLLRCAKRIKWWLYHRGITCNYIRTMANFHHVSARMLRLTALCDNQTIRNYICVGIHSGIVSNVP